MAKPNDTNQDTDKTAGAHCGDNPLSWVCDLYRLSQTIAYQADPLKVQQDILMHIVDRFDAGTGSLSLCNPGCNTLTIVAGIGLPSVAIGSEIPAGQGIIGYVAEHGEPLLLNGDLSTDPRFEGRLARRAAPRPVSAMSWPLKVENKVLGVLCLNRAPDMPLFNEADMERVELSVGLVTMVVENARLHRQQQLRMNALAEANVRMVLLSEALGKFLRPDMHIRDDDCDGICLRKFYLEILDDIRHITGAAVSVFGLFDNQGQLSSYYDRGLTDAIGVDKPDTGGLLGAVYRNRAVFRVDNETDAAGADAPPGFPPLSQLLAVPVLVQGECWGALYVINKADGHPFDDSDELNMSLFANNLAMLLERMDLLDRLQREKNEQKALIDKLQEAQSQLLQSEKLASIGQLAAGVAHEINNPVGYISSNLGSLDNYIKDLFSMLDAYEQAEILMGGDPASLQELQALKQSLDIKFLKEDIVDLVNESQEGVKRVKQIVQDLKDFSHVDQAEWQWADLHKGLDSTLNVAHNEIKYKADVIKAYGDVPHVECIASQLNQVFMNLMVNAAHAIEERGTITVRTGRRDEEVYVEVADTGKGIPPEHLKRIFDPFFTTKPVGKGTGLGLSLSYGIVSKHGGRFEVESEVGKGTTFRVWLPVRQAVAMVGGDGDDLAMNVAAGAG
jgi:signal transduction histidine kinase